ncbi:hypothetical protein [Streptacidiphilus cavernicola]|uniref:L,D-transpeptidase n=1 Tax=Streptacidiphilus cavernicola TaxID=3342716 RepID=A0ABV6VTN3_9ACTN
MAARIGSGTVVSGLTASALAVVTLLALQARSSAHETTSTAGTPGASSSATATAPGKPSAKPKPVALPAHSGSGKRIVYALGAERVWLVDPAKPSDDRTFTVQPSPVDPLVGSYTVNRTDAGPYSGSDGVTVKNGVIFAQRGSAVIGFSSAADGTLPKPDPAKKTGGIRETLGDGQALFDFAPTGTKVVVVG